MFRVLPLLVAVALSACSQTEPAGAGAEDQATSTDASIDAGETTPAPDAAETTAPVEPVPALLPDQLASVNGETITRAEFEAAVQAIETGAGGAVPPTERDQVFRQVLDELIGYRLLVQETRARKMTVSNAEVEAAIAEIQAQFPSEEVFAQMLQQQQVTLEELRENTLNDLLVAQLLDTEVTPKILVTPEQVDAFYQDNPDQFEQAERVRASHILFGFPVDADDTTRQLARARAATVLEELRAGGSFEDLARLHSQDQGIAINGGDLGYFERGQMVAPFEQAAFAFASGQLSDLVETEFVVHIIQVADHLSERTLPLDEIRPQLGQFIEEQRRQEQTQIFVAALRAKGKVEVYI